MKQGKKKLVQINTVCNTSTGRIMGDIQREAIKQGYDTMSYVGRRAPFTDLPCKKIGNLVSFWVHVGLTTLFDLQGYGSYFVTKKLIRELRKEKPDVIHLHNLHGYYLNLPLLFHYLNSEFEGELFWTFHDCWPFTGHCAYFTMAQCEKWKRGCFSCPNKKQYPISLLVDASRRNYKKKKALFLKNKKITVIVPSVWMQKQVEESFFKEYKVMLVPNGIDLTLFHDTKAEEVIKKYHVPAGKKILLGVANVWDARKGLKDFLDLAKELPREYSIVLVGLTRAQIRKLPDNVIGIEKTSNPEELAALYSYASVFINPSREESFSLVTVEAFACGTPVIVLNTSAVGELVCPDNGIVLEENSTQNYMKAIYELERKHLSKVQVSNCAKKYDHNKSAEMVVGLYEKYIGDKPNEKK